MNTLSPLYRTTVGFDRWTDLFESALKASENATSYPPYNIEKMEENEYQITMAVAGFSIDDLDIMQQENKLHISGKIVTDESESGREYLYRGIATRSFSRKFNLADHVKVTAASLNDGLLKIDLVREVPEEQKARMITIENAAGKKSKKIDAKKTN